MNKLIRSGFQEESEQGRERRGSFGRLGKKRDASRHQFSSLECTQSVASREARCRWPAATSLHDDEKQVFSTGGMPLSLANGMIENAIGTFELQIGVATNFTIDGRDYLIPMAVEERSVVAAASFMARIARKCGGFQTFQAPGRSCAPSSRWWDPRP